MSMRPLGRTDRFDFHLSHKAPNNLRTFSPFPFFFDPSGCHHALNILRRIIKTPNFNFNLVAITIHPSEMFWIPKIGGPRSYPVSDKLDCPRPVCSPDQSMVVKSALELHNCRRVIMNLPQAPYKPAAPPAAISCENDDDGMYMQGVFHVFLEIVSDCGLDEVDAFRRDMLGMADIVLQKTEEQTADQKELLAEAFEIFKLMDNATALMNDHSLMSGQVLENMQSLKGKSATLNGVLHRVDDSLKNRAIRTASEKLKSINEELLGGLESMASTKRTREDIFELKNLCVWDTERVYGIFCTCLLFCLLGKRLKNVQIAGLLLTIYCVTKLLAEVEGGEVFYGLVEILMCHIGLFLYDKVLSRKKKKEQVLYSTAVSCNRRK